MLRTKLLLVCLMMMVFGAAVQGELMLKLSSADYNGSTTWTDTSGKGNNATVWLGDPALVYNATPGGSSVVRFDGDDGPELASEIFPISNAGGFTVMLYVYDNRGMKI